MSEKKICHYCSTGFESKNGDPLCASCRELWDKFVNPLIEDVFDSKKIGRFYRNKMNFWKLVDYNKYIELVENKKLIQKERSKKRYWDNPEAKREYNRKWRFFHKDKIKQYYQKAKAKKLKGEI